MNLRELLRRLRRHWPLLVLVPLVTVASIFVFSRSRDKKYESDTVLYTGVNSGYKIDGGNNSGNSGWQAAAAAFDNLLSIISSRETQQEVSLRVLAWHLNDLRIHPQAAPVPVGGLLDKATATVVSRKLTPFDVLITPALRAALTAPTLAETYQRVLANYQTGDNSPVHLLLASKDPLFSEEALWRLNASRVKDSDLLRIDYSAADPVLCQQTLSILTDVFIRKHRQLFTGQNDTVVSYFARSVTQARARLQAAEQRQADFNERHNIVDYEKQVQSSTDERVLADEKYNQLAMQSAGVSSTLKSVESTLDKRGNATLKNQEILRLRDRLSSLNSQIAEQEMLVAPPGARMITGAQRKAATQLAGLRQQAEQLNTQISSNVDSYYGDARTSQLPVKELMSDYSKNTLTAADVRSELNLMARRRNEAAAQYNRLVPLGTQVHKIRRDVEVAEKEYMAQLEGLKQSRLSQQNGELASQLRVVDPPYLPQRSTGTRLLVLLLGGFVGALLLTGAGITATGMLSTTLQNPTYATRATSFPVAGVVPKPEIAGAARTEWDKLADDHLARQLLLKFQQPRRGAGAFSIGVLSSQSSEGKTTVATNLAASLHELNIKAVSLFPEDHALQINGSDEARFYSPLRGLRPSTTLADMAPAGLGHDAVVIIEFPAVLETAYPASLLQDLDLILVAVRADRSWQQADRTVFQRIQAVTQAPIELVLNGVLPEYVAEFIGARLRPSSASRPALPSRRPQKLLTE